jgi:Tfp pilus assembly protein PilO
MYWVLGYFIMVIVLFHVGHVFFDFYKEARNQGEWEVFPKVVITILFPLGILVFSVMTFFCFYMKILNKLKANILGRKQRKEWSKKNKAALAKDRLHA